MKNQLSSWFFCGCEILGPQSGPKILIKKNISDDWQVLETPRIKIFTKVALNKPDFRFFRSV
jgi:hypothetical protein